MSFNTAALTAYVDELKLDLIAKAVLKGRTVDVINLQAGIKNTATINTLESSPIYQAGACGYNASGTTTLGQRDITVCPIKLNESSCLDDLENFYTSKMMKPGSYNEDIPFEGLFAEEKAAQTSSFIDNLIWKGDTAGSGNLALCDGFLKTMSGDSSTVKVTGLTLTASNIIDEVDSMVAAIDPNIIDFDDLIIFMGYDKYRVYAKALRDANLFHYDGTENQGGDFTQVVPGTNVRVMAVKGLNGLTNLVASSAQNLYVGTDMLSDAEDFKIFYSDDNDEVRTIIKFKIGVNYAFSSFVVYGS